MNYNLNFMSSLKTGSKTTERLKCYPLYIKHIKVHWLHRLLIWYLQLVDLTHLKYSCIKTVDQRTANVTIFKYLRWAGIQCLIACGLDYLAQDWMGKSLFFIMSNLTTGWSSANYFYYFSQITKCLFLSSTHSSPACSLVSSHWSPHFALFLACSLWAAKFSPHYELVLVVEIYFKQIF